MENGDSNQRMFLIGLVILPFSIKNVPSRDSPESSAAE